MKISEMGTVVALILILGYLAVCTWGDECKRVGFAQGQAHGANWGLASVQQLRGIPTATPLPTPYYLKKSDSIQEMLKQ